MDATELGDCMSQLLGWPAWALWIIVALSVLICLMSVIQSIFGISGGTSSTEVSSKRKTTEFRLFQLQYLGVYLTIMLADWLQGTNMYTLYSVS